jgi:deoxyribodipyrimidine photo-lyase
VDRHGLLASQKFVEEVLWRTYWKGWLELRPQIWIDYCDCLAEAFHMLVENPQLQNWFDVACRGETGITCFDAWARELCSSGYLHNHARMWFASIWIFTLGLPWELGADFFLRHLIDGDAASNTLSWRWVAGLHTRGKHYVAKAENISRNTWGRFHPVGELNEAPTALSAKLHPPPCGLPPCESPSEGRAFLLLHEDDMGIGSLPIQQEVKVCGVGLSIAPNERSPQRCSGLVVNWIRSAASHAKAQVEDTLVSIFCDMQA